MLSRPVLHRTKPTPHRSNVGPTGIVLGSDHLEADGTYSALWAAFTADTALAA